MLDQKGFDIWADKYEIDVELTDQSDSYPFKGYNIVLAKIYDQVRNLKAKKVLDIGFGTATLSKKLYEGGCEIYGQDFSPKMIAISKDKMPKAKLYQGDFTKSLREEILNEKYDAIIATYSLHHIQDSNKKDFLKTLLILLNDKGKIFIGDVMFEDGESLQRCKQEAKDEWDNEEFYFVYEIVKKDFPSIKFEKVSSCSGVLTLEN